MLCNAEEFQKHLDRQQHNDHQNDRSHDLGAVLHGKTSAQVLSGDGENRRDEAQRDQILQAAKGHDVVVLAVQNARFRPGMLQLIEELGEQDCKLALVLLAGPWDVSYIAGADAVIGVYEYTPLAVASTVDALKTGDYLGKLPVKL